MKKPATTYRLKIALSKGKLLEPALELFARAGVMMKKISPESRRLIFDDPASGNTVMIIRPSDVPTYVEHGAVDMGIVGADVLLEQANDVYEPLDLKFGACRLSVASPASTEEHKGDVPGETTHRRAGRPMRGQSPAASVAASSWASSVKIGRRLRVATKYPNVTERYFIEKGIPIEIIKLYGSIELAPLVGLADCIVDLVSTGRTLKEHHLVVREVIAESSARLVVNRASLKLKYQQVNDVIEALRKGLQGGQQ